MASRLGEHAIVIGGSIAGLVTARVLADCFGRVTVLERDQIDERTAVRKSVPQANHVHVLMLGGQQVLTELFPGFVDRLIAMGAVRHRAGSGAACFVPDGKAYNLTGTVREPRDLGYDLFSQSRALLENCVRQSTRSSSANVAFESGRTVEGLVANHGRVQGVRVGGDGGSNTLMADLVVDAGGRGSRAPRWLTELGYQAPAETSIGCDIAYASTKYRIPDYAGEPERIMLFLAPPPKFANGALLEEIEGNLWHLTLAGRFGDYPPTDEAGFVEFVKSLHSPKLYEIIQRGERVGDITQYRYPTSVLRHYERLAAFPEGFIVIGDAISSFNPIYGQGMSSAALQAMALREVLATRGENGLGGLWSAFFPKAAAVISQPWTLAAASDFAFPQTTGERPPNMMAGMRYFAALDALQVEDVKVQRLLFEVFGLAKPLTALMEEPIQSRVVARMNRQTPAQN
jgi:2-polyprenyl-6-methoxyphenol hydroxylase-like FAD-dependent oxidoreductase